MEEKSLIGLDDKYIKILNYCSFFSQNDNDFNRVKKELSIYSTFLFEGLPGTGKTTFAHDIYNHLKKDHNIDWYEMKIETLLSYEFGKSSNNLLNFFENIAIETKEHQSTAFILIDELDSFTVNRYREDCSAIKRVLITFNKLIDQIYTENFFEKEPIIIGTSNIKDDIDTSILRRFYFHENFNIKISEENLQELINRLKLMDHIFETINISKLKKICVQNELTFGEIKKIIAEKYLESKINGLNRLDDFEEKEIYSLKKRSDIQKRIL